MVVFVIVVVSIVFFRVVAKESGGDGHAAAY